ncbi:MAG: alpha/beta fold hydrolase [Candidatus Marinimicrobia bacterium]|nr:alpha/beta fold hydrolase [Candidatus Neomarinimicrobiota bacterium]
MQRSWKKEELTYSLPGKQAALLILHGFTGNPIVLKRIARHIHKEDIAIEAPLLPGHGGTVEEINSATMEQWINTVDKTFIHLKKQHTHVFVMGYSLGSLLALELASGRTLSGIILLSTALKFTRSQHLRQMIAEDTRPLIPLDEIFDKEDPQRLQGYEMWPALGFCEVLRLSHRVRRRLQNIHAPVLACHGQKDTLTPPENLDYLKNNIGSHYVETHLLEKSHHRVVAGPDQDKIIEKSIHFIHQNLNQEKQGI